MAYPQVVTHQLQVERRTAKAHRPKTNALPLDHAAGPRTLGPPESTSQMLNRRAHDRNTPTDRPRSTQSVTIGRIYVRGTAMQHNNSSDDIIFIITRPHRREPCKTVLVLRFYLRHGGYEIVVVVTSPAGAVAKYCDEYVCLSVGRSVREEIFGTTRAIFTYFLCMLPMSVAISRLPVRLR